MTTATATIESRLDAAAAAKPKKRSSTPGLAAPHLREQAQRIIDQQRLLSDAEALLKQMEADFKAAVEPLRIELSRRLGANQGSVIVEGLMLSTKHQYSPIPLEAEKILRETFGPLFDTYFVTRREVKIKAPEKLPETLVDQLLDLGAAEVSATIVPTETYTIDKTLKPDVAGMHGQVAGIVRQFSPSVKEK